MFKEVYNLSKEDNFHKELKTKLASFKSSLEQSMAISQRDHSDIENDNDTQSEKSCNEVRNVYKDAIQITTMTSDEVRQLEILQ